MPTPRNLAASVFGLRGRIGTLRREGRDDPGLLRWYPTRRLVDPYAYLDLTTPWEQAWLTRRLATQGRTGAVVELGPWLGASTIAIARGMASAGRTDGFDTYDTFLFCDVDERVAGKPHEGVLRDGDSFRALFDARVGAHLDQVRVHEGDVREEAWAGGPIELLFVDIAKRWDIWHHVVAAFVPHVAVGGVVVQQDWAHANTPWLILWHHRWQAHFAPLAEINHSPSVAFELLEPLPAEAIEPDALADYSAEEIDAAFRWAETLVHPSMRANVAGSEVMLHALHGDPADGVAALLAAARRGLVAGELASVAAPELARRIDLPPT